jgi:hypothetical protein
LIKYRQKAENGRRKELKIRLHIQTQLYEQQQTAPDQGAAVLGDYVTRWRRWAAAGLGELQCR